MVEIQTISTWFYPPGVEILRFVAFEMRQSLLAKDAQQREISDDAIEIPRKTNSALNFDAELSRPEKTPAFDVDNFNIAVPWSPQIYFSVRGAENFHIYLWISKDLGK